MAVQMIVDPTNLSLNLKLGGIRCSTSNRVAKRKPRFPVHGIKAPTHKSSAPLGSCTSHPCPSKRTQGGLETQLDLLFARSTLGVRSRVAQQRLCEVPVLSRLLRRSPRPTARLQCSTCQVYPGGLATPRIAMPMYRYVVVSHLRETHVINLDHQI